MSNAAFVLREMRMQDRLEVSALICLSTNVWYQTKFGITSFPQGPQATEIFFDVYTALPGSSGIVVVDRHSGVIAGSCFVHVRPTHLSLGIMNVHPNFTGKGIGSLMLQNILETAKSLDKPLHLVSSLLNLDSFSLYNRAGLTPHTLYQDMLFQVPENGYQLTLPDSDRVRKATLEDVEAIVALERDLTGVERPQDYRHFIENHEKVWSVSVLENTLGNGLDAVMCSICHPATHAAGPGCARTSAAASTVLLAELNQYPGHTIIALIPCASPEMRTFAYSLGGRNIEIHAAQTLGDSPDFKGLTFPTFLPETL